MRRVCICLAAGLLCAGLAACGQEMPTPWQGEVSGTATSLSMYTVPAEPAAPAATVKTPQKTTVKTTTSRPKTAGSSSAKPTTTKPTTTKPATAKPTVPPATTPAPQPAQTSQTKPKLTPEIEEEIQYAFIELYWDDIEAVEMTHADNLALLEQQQNALEAVHLREEKLLYEQYANMGLTDSGTFKVAQQNLYNRQKREKAAIQQQIDDEEARYEEEKNDLYAAILDDIDCYIDENYTR